MFAPKCGGCARAILENYISALNTLWHPECFVCRVRSPLPTHPEAAGSGHWGEKGLSLVLSGSKLDKLEALFGVIDGVSRQWVHFLKSTGSWARAHTEAGRNQEQGSMFHGLVLCGSPGTGCVQEEGK